MLSASQFLYNVVYPTTSLLSTSQFLYHVVYHYSPSAIYPTVSVSCIPQPLYHFPHNLCTIFPTTSLPCIVSPLYRLLQSCYTVICSTCVILLFIAYCRAVIHSICVILTFITYLVFCGLAQSTCNTNNDIDTAPRTVWNPIAYGARTQSCANHVQHIGPLSHVKCHLVRRDSLAITFDRVKN